MSKPAPRTIGRHQNGFSMLEVLISVLILSVGLLGLGSLQVVGVQNNNSAFQRSQATLLSYEIVEAMRANRWGAINGRYDREFEDAVPDPTASMAAMDISLWLDNVTGSLAGGEGSINVTSEGDVTVRIRWLDERQSEEVDEQLRSFEYRTEI